MIALVIVLPLATGAVIGWFVSRQRRGRLRGWLAFLGGLAGPMFVALCAAGFQDRLGAWDALWLGLLGGLGFLGSSHVAFGTRERIIVPVAVLACGLCALEAGFRLVAPAPPRFPMQEPHLFLTGQEREMLFQGGGAQPAEAVCRTAYRSFWNTGDWLDKELSDALPAAFTPRPQVSRRVLHLGDSMVLGFRLPREATFEAALERLEPGVEHVNAGMRGTAPDDFLAVLPAWLDRAHFDEVVLYLNELNDLIELDSGHPCTGDKSLFTYDGLGPALRPPTPPRGRGKLNWILRAPAPYLVRALVDHSVVDAFLAATWNGIQLPSDLSNQDEDTALRHLDALLRAAQDELKARGIPLRIVDFPVPARPQGPAGDAGRPGNKMGGHMLEVARRLNVPVYDAGEWIRPALQRGEPILQPDGTHFNAAGNANMARWLHDEVLAGSHDVRSMSRAGP
jgi:hypothetical protein